MNYSLSKKKYQYGVYIQNGNASPYINELPQIFDYFDLMRYVESIEKRHNHYRQIFYIDNEFYDNKFTLQCGGTYYKFLVRPIQEWQSLSFKNFKPYFADNIIYPFKKSI